MANNDRDAATIREIIRALDEAIAKGDWQTGLFFRVIGERLTKTREQLVAALTAKAEAKVEQAAQTVVASGISDEDALTVYVLLFQTGGLHLQSWQRLLETIDNASVGRPIYDTQRSVRAALRTKADQTQHAYVAMRISKNDVLAADPAKPSLDKDGRTLLTIKKGAIRADRIIDIFHDGFHYILREQGLVKVPGQGNE